MEIKFNKVLEHIGGIASDVTDYKTIKKTWNSELSSMPKCPPFGFFADVWKELVYSGQEVGTWSQEREKAYINEGIFIQKTMDILMEYNVAMAAGDLSTAEKYQIMLEEIHQKRQAIKDANPKP